VEQIIKNMKTGVISGAEYRKHKKGCHLEQNTENMKTGVISGAEYRKHENWCHQWGRVPKT
jgi:hypothetical protein